MNVEKQQTTFKLLFFCYFDFNVPSLLLQKIFMRNVIVVLCTVRSTGNGKTQMILMCTVPPLSLDKLTRDPGCPGLSPPRDFFERKRHETSHHLHSNELLQGTTCGHHHSNRSGCEAELVNGREGMKTATAGDPQPVQCARRPHQLPRRESAPSEDVPGHGQ